MSHFLDCSKEALALARPYRWPGGPWHAGGKLPDQPLPVGPSRPLAWEGEVAVPAPEDQRLGDGASDHGHHGQGAKPAGEEREPGSCLHRPRDRLREATPGEQRWMGEESEVAAKEGDGWRPCRYLGLA